MKYGDKRLLCACLKPLVSGFLLLSSLTTSGQQLRDCGVADVYRQMVLKNKTFGIARQAFEDSVQAQIRRTDARGGRTTDRIIRIPVVVHVIHNNPDSLIFGGKGNANISVAQIESQIRILNEDYRKKEGTRGYNTNPVGVDMEIEFYLATEDPNGNLTTGILRRYAPKTSYNIGSDLEKISALSYWPSDRYLNMWIVPELAGYLGYAQFAAANFDGLQMYYEQFPKTDGVFLSHAYVGDTGDLADQTYAYGRTATHEIGHWLGLIHTWGDDYCGTDYCDDTPPAEAANRTRFCNDTYSTCVSGNRTKNMIENYLDYSPDACMNIFTADQKKRVRAVLEISNRRQKLVAASNSLADTDQLTLLVYPNPVTGQQVAFDATFKGLQNLRFTLTTTAGDVVYTDSRSTQPSNRFTIPTKGLTQGIYVLQVRTGSETKAARIYVR